MGRFFSRCGLLTTMSVEECFRVVGVRGQLGTASARECSYMSQAFTDIADVYVELIAPVTIIGDRPRKDFAQRSSRRTLHGRARRDALYRITAPLAQPSRADAEPPPLALRDVGIGIGGGGSPVAPLPHHRTSGSASGGSRS